MQKDQVVHLDCKIGRIQSLHEALLAVCVGKKVLNVGATGGIETYLPKNTDQWLHYQLMMHADEVTGVDIDSESIKYGQEYGYEFTEANCETMDLGQKYDAIILSDVIEHMNAPVNALENLKKHLNDHGAIYISTPNALAFGNVAKAILGRNLGVYYDHVSIYLPEHIQAICDRLGLVLAEVQFFSQVDRRSLSFRIKSWVSYAVSTVFPRFDNSFLAVIRKAP